MKKSTFAGLLILGFVLTVLGQRAESVPRRSIDPNLPKKPVVYELRCRGGKTLASGQDMYFMRMGERTSASGEVIYTLMLFARGQRERGAGMDSSALAAGNCAWIDRPLNSNEYGTMGDVSISFETPANAQLKQKLRGEPIDSTATAAERFPDALTIPEYLKDSTHCWSFFGVFKDGYFQTSSHNYWKYDPNVYVPRRP